VSDLEELFVRVARVAAHHRDTVGDRPVAGTASREDAWAAFDLPLPDDPTPADLVVEELLAAADGHLVGTVGPRYFGFVIGGSTPAAAAADMLAVGWDQNAFNPLMSPAAEGAERAAGEWAKDLLGLPGSASVGFVTGAQAANTVGIACGRHWVLEQAGYDVEVDGLIGAPRVRVVTGFERHATIDRSLRLLGLGTASLVPVLTDDSGTVDVEDLAKVLSQEPERPTIVCLQAGNVNTGASDDFARAVPLAKDAGAWVHVDGAFGLWAAASPGRAHLVDGVDRADSWATDAHKWLNVPYDSGLAIVADADVHGRTMAYSAAYLAGSGREEYSLGDLVPDSSRRARGFAVWAALRELGRSGVADLVERSCLLAGRMAERLAEGGATIANDVVLNQVLAGFGTGDGLGSTTDEIVAEVQRDGTCWLGATTWHDQRLIRISVANATTTEADIDRSADAILAAARSVGRGGPKARHETP
jgi:glutamate/tyrosine decarboxylase-like PLP-dependent enzyme